MSGELNNFWTERVVLVNYVNILPQNLISAALRFDTYLLDYNKKSNLFDVSLLKFISI